MHTLDPALVALRALGAERITASAAFLVGKTIAAVEARPHADDCDSVNVLRLTFTDGATADIAGSYGGYSGHSCDEYVETIDIRPVG